MTPVAPGRAARRLGWRWENSLTRRLRSVPGWDAIRMGAASNRLPDVIAFPSASARHRRTMVFECKATSTRKPIHVGRDQVLSLAMWARGPLCGSDSAAWLACRWTRDGTTVMVPVEPWCHVEPSVTVTRHGIAHGVTRPDGAGERDTRPLAAVLNIMRGAA